MELSQKPNSLSHFFSSFLKSNSNFAHFQKKMALIADVFRKLRTPKNKVTSMRKKSVTEDPSKSHMVNASKHCSNLKDTLFTIFPVHWEVNYPTKSLC